MLWLVPCNSKVEKFERIIEQKKAQHKSTDTIKIVNVQDKKSALLFQDMFPITEKHLHSQYIRGNQPVLIADPEVIAALEKTANKVIALIRRGIKFTPTQPDAMRIETLMLAERQKDYETQTMKDSSEQSVKISPPDVGL